MLKWYQVAVERIGTSYIKAYISKIRYSNGMPDKCEKVLGAKKILYTWYDSLDEANRIICRINDAQNNRLLWKYNDGGASEAGYHGIADDCVCRAISIALSLDYKEAKRIIDHYAETDKTKGEDYANRNARTGVYFSTMRKIMRHYGWHFIQTAKNKKVHLRKDELPKGCIVAVTDDHCVAVIDGVLYDTFDCSAFGAQEIIGYFTYKN